MNRIFVSSLLKVLGVTSFLASSAMALQMKEVIEDQRLPFTISLYDLSRLEVRGDRINKVFGSSGAFVVDHDTDRGHLYIKPSPQNGRRPISLSLTTEKGIVQDLILTPLDIPSETIVLKPLSNNTSKQDNAPKPVLSFMKDLVQGRVTRSVAHDVKEVSLWEGVEIKRIATYGEKDLVGEVLTFKNLGDTPLILQEDYFKRLPEDVLENKTILAIGLQKNQVDPQEIIKIYRVLRENPGHGIPLPFENLMDGGTHA